MRVFGRIFLLVISGVVFVSVFFLAVSSFVSFPILSVVGVTVRKVFPLLVFICWALRGSVGGLVFPHALNSTQMIWWSHILDIGLTVGRFRNVFYFLVIIVVPISVTVFAVLVWTVFLFCIIVFIWKVEFNEKFSLFFALNDVPSCVLPSCQNVPSFWELLNFFNIFVFSEQLIDVFNIIFVKKWHVKPNVLSFAAL